MEISDMTWVVIKITKVIWKEASRDKDEECLHDLAQLVAAFNSNFDERTQARLPRY